MEWPTLLMCVVVGAFILWRHAKSTEASRVASERLEKDTALYRHIKTGMREYNWRERDQNFWDVKDGGLLFETAHLSAFKVDHFAEFRVGFYFKDIGEFGLYGHFAGNADDHYESYYRSDQSFKKEERLAHLDDD
jgi:hypothetical protein